MRNFKKFLALVLAMLMVSACAVSVSAAYSDQADINATGFAEAVSILSDLKVMQGPGDGTFNPNGTLTRAEAAVIMAKLDTGSYGQKIDWVSSSCSFTDVKAEWSFAYINYASQHGIMDGIGDGKFNPDGKLTIAEAIVMAVKAAGERQAVADLDKISKPSIWYVNWINVAESKGLVGFKVMDYEAPCSRAMMAKIAYNVFNTVEAIQNSFDMVKVNATVASVGEKEVVLTDTTGAPLTVDRAAFETAMAATGAEGNAESIKGEKVTMTYSKDKGVVYGVTVNSTSLTFDYADGTLVRVVENNANTKYVTIAGQKYVVGTSNEVNTGVIGSTSVVKAVKIEKNLNNNTVVALGETEGLPVYYTGVAFDDNSDGYYDRVVLNVYNIGTMKANTYDPATINNVKYTFDSIYNLNGSEAFTNKQANVYAINYTGKEPVFDNETPVLYHVAKNNGTGVWDVDILKIAEVVEGKLTGISNANSNVTVDGIVYGFAAEKVTPDTWTLNQTVKMYTIDNKYVKFTASSKTAKTVIVDNAVVKDGKAVVTGFEVGNAYNKIDLIVDGIFDTTTSKLYTKTAKELNNTVDGKKYAGEIAIGDFKNGNMNDYAVKFEEGTYYDFVVTTDGVYVSTAETGKKLGNLSGTNVDGEELAVKGGYVYYGDVAKYVADNTVILEKVTATGDNAKNKYADTYNRYTSYDNRTGVDAVLCANSNGKIGLIYVTAQSKKDITIDNIGTDVTIVQIMNGSVVDAGYEYNTYEAVDILTGKKVIVKSNIGAEAGAYYTVKGDTLVEDTTNLWVKKNDVKVEYNGGIVGTVKANITKLSMDANGVKTVKAPVAGDYKPFGIDQITIYSANKNGIIRVDGNGNAVTLKIDDVLMTAAHKDKAISYISYVVDGKMVLVSVNDEVYSASEDGRLVKIVDNNFAISAIEDLNLAIKIYPAIDVVTGEKIGAVVKTDDSLENGKYYVVKGYSKNGSTYIDSRYTCEAKEALWVKDNVITVTYDKDGKATITADTTKIVLTNCVASTATNVKAMNFEEKNITIYDLDESGNFKLDAENKKALTKTVAETLLETGKKDTKVTFTYISYIVNDTMVLLNKVVPVTPAE